MSYMLIDIDESGKNFVSFDGIEKCITLSKKSGFTYYLHSSRKFLVVLVDGWIKSPASIGCIVELDGKLISEVPHPALHHGKFEIGGIVNGDEKSFKLIIIPYSNERQFFIEYNILTKSFK